MARGKIRIKRIENETNRQVTYSKRRNVLFKKTHKLTVLYDAKVSLIMFSGNSELREYISPSATTKQLFDHYQKTLGIDLWSSHYERMQEDLKKLKEVNKSLRREIRQRRGESLSDLNLEELYGLEQNMESAVKVIRDCKYRVIGIQIETLKKKDARIEYPHGLVDNGGDYGPVTGRCSNGDSCINALRPQPKQPNFHSGERSDLTTDTLLE